MKKLSFFILFMTVIHASANADSVGVRGSVGDFNTDEDLDLYELVYIHNLPWVRGQGAHRIQTQIEITGGVLDGGNETGFLGTLVPQVSFQANRIFLDLGGGIAVLSEDKFGRQDFGDSPQFIAQGGAGVMLTERIKAGLRLRHMSDAGIHDSGDDMNIFLVELRYDLE